MDRAASEEQLATEVSSLMKLMHPVKAAAAREAGPEIGPDRSSMLLLFPLMRGPLRPGALAEASFADPSTISRQVAELVKRGFVRREPDPSDGRASLLAITAAGREVCERLRTVRRDMLAAAVDGWTDDELATFAALLTRFNDALGLVYCPPVPRTFAVSSSSSSSSPAEQELA